MKSKTSYFNPSVLLKDITRFSPVWALYTIFLGMLSFFLFHRAPDYINAERLQYTFGVMAVFTMIYAILCAMTLFSDLYNTRMCNALHAMPLRREGWFFTHFTAGLLFSLVPNLLLVLLNLFFFGPYWPLALIWLAGATLEFLFFFGLAVFCALCAGSRLGAVALYGIANFFALLGYGWIQVLYITRLPGVIWNFENLLVLFPIVKLQNFFFTGHYEDVTEQFYFEGFVRDSWIYLLILALLGLVLSALAVLLYRKRNLEFAGDLVAFHPVAPIFLLVATMTSGLLFYLVSAIFSPYTEPISGSHFFLFFGMAVGFFLGQMLLHKTVKVWNKKNIISYVVLSLCLVCSFLLTSWDPFGITRRIPKAEDVARCTVSVYQDVELTDTADLIKLEEVHKDLISLQDYEPTPDYHSYPVTLHYQLKNGSSLYRRYTCYNQPSIPAHNQLKEFFSTWQAVLHTNDLDELAKEIGTISIDIYEQSTIEADNADSESTHVLVETGTNGYYLDTVPRKWVMPLLRAIQQDCMDGNFYLDSYAFQDDVTTGPVGYIYFTSNRNHASFDVLLGISNRRTLAVIDQIMQEQNS